MGQPFVGEIRMFGGNFAPAGWAMCDGAVLPISENETLFQLIGTTYGGDGQETFALPDLRGRVPIHQGNGFILSETGGAESVTLTSQQIPSHTHALTGYASAATSSDPADRVYAAADIDMYTDAAPGTAMSASAIGAIGGSQPHENMAPYLAITFIISLFGIFPSPT